MGKLFGPDATHYTKRLELAREHAEDCRQPGRRSSDTCAENEARPVATALRKSNHRTYVSEFDGHTDRAEQRSQSSDFACVEKGPSSLVRLSRVSTRACDEPARRRCERSDDPADLAAFRCERDAASVHQAPATASDRRDGQDSEGDGQGCCRGTRRKRELRSRKPTARMGLGAITSSSPFRVLIRGILANLFPSCSPVCPTWPATD